MAGSWEVIRDGGRTVTKLCKLAAVLMAHCGRFLARSTRTLPVECEISRSLALIGDSYIFLRRDGWHVAGLCLIEAEVKAVFHGCLFYTMAWALGPHT